MPFVIRRRVAPPTSSRTAARYSSGVVPLSGSMLSGGPSSAQPPSTGSGLYIIPSTTRSRPPTFPSRPGYRSERQVSVVPPDRRAGPELAVVRDPNDGRAGLLGGGGRDRRCRLNRGGRIRDPVTPSGCPHGEENGQAGRDREGGAHCGDADQAAPPPRPRCVRSCLRRAWVGGERSSSVRTASATASTDSAKPSRPRVRACKACKPQAWMTS